MAKEISETEKLLKKIEAKYYQQNPTKKKRNSVHSREWFRKEVTKNHANIRTSQLVRDRKSLRSVPIPGKMYMYDYDPKHKKTLPYYDKFPLIFPFNVGGKDGKRFYGINLHYLPPKMRLVVFQQLLHMRNERHYRRRTKLDMNWAKLEALASHKAVSFATKQYLFSHVRSRFTEVPANYWEIVINMPVARFQKASSKTVWKDSIK